MGLGGGGGTALIFYLKSRCMRKTHEEEQTKKQAGAVPSSGLVNSLVKIEFFFCWRSKIKHMMNSRWSLDEVKVKPW